MTNYILKKRAQYIINYIDLIEQSKNLINKHYKDLEKTKPGEFGNLYTHYKKRIDINNKIIQYLQNRINNIKKNIV